MRQFDSLNKMIDNLERHLNFKYPYKYSEFSLLQYERMNLIKKLPIGMKLRKPFMPSNINDLRILRICLIVIFKIQPPSFGSSFYQPLFL